MENITINYKKIIFFENRNQNNIRSELLAIHDNYLQSQKYVDNLNYELETLIKKN